MPTLVHLRDVVDSDVVVFFEHQADPEASEMAAFPIRNMKTHSEQWSKRMTDPTITARAIISEGEVAGYVVGWESHGKHEVGYWIGKDFWGRGIATAALARFLNLIRVRPLFAYVTPGNAGSRRVLEKCGFIETGKLIEDDGARLVEFFLN